MSTISDIRKNLLKDFTLSSPSATGLVPYDLVGTKPPKRRRKKLSKWRIDQLRDERGRFADEQGYANSLLRPEPKFALKDRPVKETPLEHTSLGKLIIEGEQPVPTQWSQSMGEDLWLKSILKDLGYDAKPLLGSKDDVKQAVEEGGIELWRGIVDPTGDYVRAFKTGELYGGNGTYGDGTYASTDSSVASDYAGNFPGNSGLVHMALRKGAKIIDYSAADNLARDKYLHYEDLQNKALKNKDPKERVYDYFRKISRDAGRVAALAGYDAIKVSDIYVILNRGALIVEQ
jgi:hypothetical protein